MHPVLGSPHFLRGPEEKGLNIMASTKCADARWAVRYLLRVPGFCGCSGDVVHKLTSSGQDAEQGCAIEQSRNIIQPTYHFWEALVRKDTTRKSVAAQKNSKKL